MLVWFLRSSYYLKWRNALKKLAIIILLILLLPLAVLLLPKQQITSNTIESFDDYVPALMKEAAIPGLAIAKISEGKADIRTYGYANIEQNKAVTDSTLFNIASVSKPIMGIALLQLVDQGKLELDCDINDYLPFEIDNPHIEGEKITLRHLVSHSAGIADYYDVNSYSENQDSPISLEAHLKALLTPAGQHYNKGGHYLESEPGNKRKYSNLGAALAGYLVEATTGVSLAQYSQQLLFNSLAMTNTSWLLHDLNLADIATPYEVETCVPFIPLCADTESSELNYLIGEYVNPPAKYKHFKAYPHFGNPQYPDGGVRTSVKELSQFLVAVLNNTTANGDALLSESQYSEMMKLQLPESVSTNQRFFWRDNSMGLTGHMGSDLGVFSALYFDVKSKQGFIIIMNRGMDSKSASAMKKIAQKMMTNAM